MRQMEKTDTKCSGHFAPTEKNRETLIAEGVAPDQIVATGNTVMNTLLWMKEQVLKKSDLQQVAITEFFESGWEQHERMFDVLNTGHRRKNFGEMIFLFILRIASPGWLAKAF